MDQFKSEIEHEARVNNTLRNTTLQRSLAIPIPSSWEENTPIWCSLTLYLYLRNADQSIARVWQKVIEYVQDRIGYIRSGYFSQGQNEIRITGKIDLYEHIDLMNMKHEIQQHTGVVCKMAMDNFSFCEKPNSNHSPTN
jgi:hypothetical protein